MPVCAVSGNSLNPKVALIVKNYALGTSSVLINLIRMLALSNVSVDIFTDTISLSVPYFPPVDKVRLFIEPQHSSFDTFFIKLYRRLLVKFRGDTHIAQVARLSYEYFWFAKWVSGVLKKKSFYNVVMYASYPAIYVSSFFKKKSATSIYYNLELLDDSLDEYEGVGFGALRRVEQEHLHYLDWVFATSPKRGECFQKLTGFPSNRIRVLPVLPLTGEAPKPNRYFYDKFSLDETVSIVIWTGIIGERMLQMEVIDTVHNWPKNTVLIFHTFRKGTFDQGYGLSLQKAAESLPVYFSAEALDYSEISSAIASAHIGFAFYDTMDTNMGEIFLSSNKIIEYLRCGVPVITSYNKDLEAFFAEYKCGFSVHPEDVPRAVAVILHDYDLYRQAAFNASCGELSFEKYFYAAFDGIIKDFSASILNRNNL